MTMQKGLLQSYRGRSHAVGLVQNKAGSELVGVLILLFA